MSKTFVDVSASRLKMLPWFGCALPVRVCDLEIWSPVWQWSEVGSSRLPIGPGEHCAWKGLMQFPGDHG